MILAIFALSSFAAASSRTTVDPMVALIAADFAVPVSTAAMLSSAYAVPFALFQPILGPIGDIWGKSRLLRASLWLLTLALLAGAVVQTLGLLMATRFIGGIGGGGTTPSGMALIGDRYEGPARQIALSRFVAAGLAGQIFGGSISGIVADTLGWRTTLFLAGVVALAAALVATVFVREPPDRVDKQFSFQEAIRGYRLVFRNRRAFLCFGTVCAEGIALWGVTPYVADLLIRSGTGAAREAGFAVGGIGVGGLLGALVLPLLLRWLGRHGLMAIGGVLGATGLVALALGLRAPWIVAGFVVTGFGYMMLHNSIQTESVELAPSARSSAYSMHAFFFFTGMSLGPIVVGMLLAWMGTFVALTACAGLFALTGIVVALLFSRLDQPRE